MTPCAPVSRVGRAHMSNSIRNLHRRREDAVIVVGMISIGAVTGRAVVAVSIVTSIVTIIIACYRCRRCHETLPAQVADSH